MQYVFIYQALLEHYLYGDTELEVTSLETHLQKIYNKIPGTSSNGLEEEFKVSDCCFGLSGKRSRGICANTSNLTCYRNWAKYSGASHSEVNPFRINLRYAEALLNGTEKPIGTH